MVTQAEKRLQFLPSFERPLRELEDRLEQASTEAEREPLRQEVAQKREEIFSNLTAWQCVELARHLERPRMLDFASYVLDDLIELHGDRAVGDDPAMVAGIGRFQGQTVAIAGQQKGSTTEERARRRFGSARPEGYRKALRVFQMAERLRFPIITLVDTQAADPSVAAESRGQGPVIAKNLHAMMQLETPIFSAILAEGGSGGALGIAVADYVVMMQYAIYVICPPARLAEILWRDAGMKETAADAMRLTARELKDLGVIDDVVPEPPGGAHRDPRAAANNLGEEIERFLHGCKTGQWSKQKRYEKFRKIGVFAEAG